MESFEEFLANQDQIDDIRALEESYLSRIRAEILLVSRKVEDLERKVLAENEIARKIDLLAQQNKWSSIFSVCLLAIQMNDISILSRFRKS